MTVKRMILISIFFCVSIKCAELLEDWGIVSYSDTRIELKDISKGVIVQIDSFLKNYRMLFK